MFKKILVATDASEYSKRALKTALEIARTFNAEIELLFVTYLKEVYWGYNVAYNILVPQEQLDEAGELALNATLEGIDLGEVPLKKKQEQGYPASVILEEIEKENIDLVVMGSHGYGPIAGSVLGSVSQRVVQRAECPVMIVK
ncbi:universal stress protein UspA-like protein [Desulfosporosinus orientis DSM 765]|uniref:Universal stress protein n=1 Tax=Desulfosporosinus orientis (strain ATCC 19365 / DSM 765 / NCIMB 8382 / VKM B-1628 / Singapore I) TaxID=768706 RepID=G7W7S8_DESOD|nr:universal stress protein [Desulfosporosinus orientis]AET66143.1 universal stress protein UspA-like protein [Desulfosporosinus orientis DSM 765]